MLTSCSLSLLLVPYEFTKIFGYILFFCVGWWLELLVEITVTKFQKRLVLVWVDVREKK